MDYAQRVARTHDAMERQGIDLLAIPPSDDLRYLTGFSPLLDERPCYLFLAPRAQLFVIPVLNADQAAQHVQLPMLTYADADGPQQALHSAYQSLGLCRRISVGETMRADAFLLLQRMWPKAEFALASDVLAPLRMRKFPEEIEALRRAAATADRAAETASIACRPGATEADVAAAAAERFRATGAQEILFAIVGSGANSAFPHHHTTTRILQPGEPVVLDLGGRLDGYCSDITRMVYLGAPSPRYRAIHAIVEEAVQAALAVIRPGTAVKDVDLAARRTIEAAGYGQYFVHRTGHGIGLSIHEPPSITHTNTMPLEEGMVFSVEPGIYLPGEFGVRLEEIAVVTADGGHVLSTLPRVLRVTA